MALNKKFNDPFNVVYEEPEKEVKKESTSSTTGSKSLRAFDKGLADPFMRTLDGGSSPSKGVTPTTPASGSSNNSNLAPAKQIAAEIANASINANTLPSINPTQTVVPTIAPIETPQPSINPIGNFSYNPYAEAQSVVDARNQYNNHLANKVNDWTGGTYGSALQQAMDKIANREKFSYDLNGDALYQQYKDQYINQGKIAMQDAIGQASALTGGYGNSYAASVGNQAYQGYLNKLNEVIPELYSMAYDRYNNEGQDLLNQLSMYNNAYNQEYGQYRDQVGDWQTEANRLQNEYNNAYNRDYGQYSDAYNREFANYQSQVSQNQFAQNLAYEQAKLNETIRQNMANEAYKNAQLQSDEAYKYAALKADQDYRNASLQADIDYKNASLASKNTVNNNTVNVNSNSALNAKATDNTRKFTSSIMTPDEFNQRGKTATVNGKKVNSYSDYVDAVLEKWYNSEELDESEVSYLKMLYGL